MKRATLIAALVACYWIIRVVTAPAPTAAELPTTIDELQMMEAKHTIQDHTAPLLDDVTGSLSDAE